MTNLRSKVIHGLGWSTGAQIFRQSSSFIITTILARLLSPDDFGLVGMVTVFTGFALIFSELGISAALIQNQDVDDRHYSSAFLLNLLSGSILTALFILLSPVISSFYDKPQLQPLIFAMSFSFVISSLGIVHKAVLTKKLDFKKLTMIESVSTICGGATGIVLAYRGFGVWSLIFQMLIFASTNVVLFWVLSPLRIRFLFSLDAIRDIFSFSANLTGFNIINYFARNIDYLLIGKFLGAEALGYYTLAYKLMMYPLSNISQMLARVLYPAFSKLQTNIESIRINYLKLVKSIAFVTFPMLLGIIAITPEFITYIYGEKWSSSIILIRILCICGIFQSIHNISGTIILSLGRSDLQFRLGLFSTFFTVLAISIGLQWGIVGVAISYTIEQIIWIIIAQHIVNRLISLKDITFYFSFVRILFFTTLMTVIVFTAKLFNMPHPLNLVVYILLGGVFYVMPVVFFMLRNSKKLSIDSLLNIV